MGFLGTLPLKKFRFKIYCFYRQASQNINQMKKRNQKTLPSLSWEKQKNEKQI